MQNRETFPPGVHFAPQNVSLEPTVPPGVHFAKQNVRLEPTVPPGVRTFCVALHFA